MGLESMMMRTDSIGLTNKSLTTKSGAKSLR